jgi:hypothetical protein
MRLRRTLFLLLTLVSSTAACGNKKATCETVTDHLMEFMKDDKDVEIADRAKAIEKCEKRKPPQETLDCMMAAKTKDEVISCAMKAGAVRKEPDGDDNKDARRARRLVSVAQMGADRMCACKDKECADGVLKDVNHEMEQVKQAVANPPEDVVKKVAEQTDKMNECLKKLGS